MKHLTPLQRKLVFEAGWQSRGVPLTEIIRGVETNTPFRMTQDIKGDRVNTTYVDPRLLPPNAGQLEGQAFLSAIDDASRHVTFVPGADATAPPVNLPQTGASCSNAELNDTTNSCCTPQMLAEFGQHLSTARAAVGRAVKRLEGTELIDCQVRKHFGNQTSPAALAQIAGRLRVAASELFMSRHGWRCRESGSGLLGCDKRNVQTDRGNRRGAVGALVPPGRRTGIVVCVDPQAPFTEWVSLLHEVMHRVGVSGTEVYESGSGYPGSDPMSNADSYAQLVEELGAESWSPCKLVPFDLKAVGGANPGSGYVLGARLEITPRGPGVRIFDWTLGVNFLWMPKLGVVSEAGDEKKDVLGRGYVGAEGGARLTLPNKYGALQFEATVGAGGLLEKGNSQFLASGRAEVGFRFGKGLSGPEVGLEMSRLQSFTELAGGEWVIAVSGGYRFGRTDKRK